MLIEFTVENFKSFRDPVTLSMIPVSDKGKTKVLKNYFEYQTGKKLLTSAAIYGANASGKTNILKALDFMAFMVKEGHSFQQGEKFNITPFKLDPEAINKPSSFNIQFISNGIKYAYGFIINNESVLEEYLYYFPHGRQKVIFERTAVDQYRFVDDKARQNRIKELTSKNTLYLSSATKLNYELVQPAFSWFAQQISFYLERDPIFEQISIGYLYKDQDLLQLTTKAMEKADLGIQKINIKQRDNDANIDKILSKVMTNPFKDKYKEFFSYQVSTVHKSTLENDKEYLTDFSWNEESKGTQKFVGMIVPILLALLEGEVIIIDEMEQSLHPMLMEYLVELFHDPTINKENAQLIFTTHDTNLFSQNILRRDQIWLTEKNVRTGITDFYSLVELKIRNDENINNGYLKGKYGAIPFVKGGELFE